MATGAHGRGEPNGPGAGNRNKPRGMPFDIVQEPEHDLVITVPYDVIKDDELLEYYGQRLTNGTLGPGMKEFVDGRWIGQFDVSAEGQAKLVELLASEREALEGMQWGFLADSMVSFGMFRMFESQKKDLPFTTSVFRTPGRAAEWLGVPHDVLMIEAPV